MRPRAAELQSSFMSKFPGSFANVSTHYTEMNARALVVQSQLPAEPRGLCSPFPFFVSAYPRMNIS